MFNKKLKQRLKSLENKLDLAYIPDRGKWDGDEHVSQNEEWGFFSKVSRMLKVWEEKNEKKK